MMKKNKNTPTSNTTVIWCILTKKSKRGNESKRNRLKLKRCKCFPIGTQSFNRALPKKIQNTKLYHQALLLKYKPEYF